MNNVISALRILPVEAASASNALPEEGKFLEALQNSISQAEGAQGHAASQVSAMLDGQGTDVHSAMIAVEKADLSFQLMMQVRNKIVQAYQQISSMQF